MTKLFPFNYLGNKYKDFPLIEPYIDYKTIDTYIELFAGSASITLQIMKKLKDLGIRKKFVLNDKNPYIVWFHKQMRDDHLELIKKMHPITKEEFNQIRDRGDYTDEEVMLLWLNSYGISLRFNQKNKKINVPWGNRYNFNPYNVNECYRLYTFHEVEFTNFDYEEFDLTPYDPKTTWIFIDPPYFNSKYEYQLHSEWVFDQDSLQQMIEDRIKCRLILAGSSISWNVFNDFKVIRTTKYNTLGRIGHNTQTPTKRIEFFIIKEHYNKELDAEPKPAKEPNQPTPDGKPNDSDIL
jgi:site-specific DNA-adenine methylase